MNNRIITLWVCVLVLAYTGMSVAQTIPSHETEIIMLGIEDEVLYSLDANGLLLMNNLKNEARDFAVLIRAPLLRAFFEFPYITMIDTSYNMHVYNVSKHFIPFSGSFFDKGNQGAVTFSEDFELFAYTASDGVRILQTNTWTELRVLPYQDSPAVFLVFSTNKQNIMTYQAHGKIEYFNVQNGTLIKSISTEAIISSVFLNHSYRYAIGFTDRAIISLDAVTGKIVDKILFTHKILNIYPSHNNTDTTQFTMMSEQVDKAINAKVFSLSDSGYIQEDDLFTTGLLKSTSQMINTSDTIYAGFQDGEIWSFGRNTQNNIDNIIVEDNSIAIYDAHYIDNHILLASTEGIYKIPMNVGNAQGTILDATNISLQEQTLQNPVFISYISHAPSNTLDNTQDNNSSLALLSTSSLYENRITSTLQSNTLGNFNLYANSDETISSLPSLLFSIDDALELRNPIPLVKNISKMKIIDDFQAMYSLLDAQLFLKKENIQNNVPILSSRFIFQLSIDEERPLFWSTTPLGKEEQITSDPINSNIIYPYQYMSDEAENTHPLSAYYRPLALSFINDGIYDFEIISHSEKLITLLVIEYHSRNNESNYYLVEFQIDSDDETPLIYPQYIQVLASINGGEPLQIIPVKSDYRKFLVLHQETISLLSLALQEKKLEFIHTIQYPKEFGILLGASVHPMINDKNISSSDNSYIISLVDKNNTISILQHTQHNILHTLLSFYIDESNKLQIYAE